MAKKVTVDKANCVGCGLCTGVCPVAFQMGEDGLSEVILPDGVVTDEVAADVQNAADQCPNQAIKIEG